MSNWKTTTIITSPPASSRSLPGLPSRGSPTVPKQYRIEERKRTVYVTSDRPPNQWDLDTIFGDAQGVNGELQDETDGEQPRRRAKSLVETQFIISEAHSTSSSPDHSTAHSPGIMAYQSSPERGPGATPRMSTYHQVQRAPGRNTMFGKLLTPPGSPRTPRTSPVHTVQPRPRILFYHKHDPYYGFTNFSAHPVIYNGKRYPTSEHLFQSFKFHEHRPDLAEHIRTYSERPSAAFSEARRFQPEVRQDWKHVNIPMMEIALWHKFTQHADLKAELLGTGDAELIEDSDKDAFWGVGADGRGRNELGKALERLRTRLRNIEASQ